MSGPIGDTLISAQNDMMRIHRRVVQVGAVAAWLVAAFLLLIGYFTSNSDLYIDAIGPILAAGFMTTQIVLHKENGGLALFGSGLVIMVMYSAVGDPKMVMPVSLALVVVCALGMLFVDRWQRPVTVATAAFLGVAPFAWGLPIAEALPLGVLMLLSFVMTTVILATIRNAATALNEKFQVMFDESPSALIEEDWSRAIDYVRSEYSGRSDRIRQFLVAYPEVVRRAVSKARITRVNRSAIDLLGAGGPEDLLGSRNPEILTEENLDAFVDTLVAHYEGSDLFEVEFPVLTFQGRQIWIHARCVTNSAGTGPDSVLVALADVSSARAKEEALGDLVRAKDAFIASISHELRTPLTAVVGLTSEMTTLPMGDAEKAELMELVSGQAAEMSHIVDDLLVAARSEIGSISMVVSEVDLDEELAAVIESVGLDLDSTPDRLPSILADPARVRQILRNLLTNLDRYGGPHRRVIGGVIGERAWLEVRDDGDGVPPGDSDRIFEPYATAHSGVAGSVGLGLAVARQLAELMGGTLRYRREGRESVFRLELPLSSATVAV